MQPVINTPPQLSAAAYVAVMRKASQLPEIQELDAQIADVRDKVQRADLALKTAPPDKYSLAPDLYLESRDMHTHQYLKYRTFIGIGSYAVALGLTKIPALAPFSSLIWIATFVGVVPAIVDRVVYKKMDGWVENDVNQGLEKRKSSASGKLGPLSDKRNTMFDSALQRLLAQAQQEEANRRSDPNARVTVEEETVHVGGVRVDKKRDQPQEPDVRAS